MRVSDRSAQGNVNVLDNSANPVPQEKTGYRVLVFLCTRVQFKASC
jgi:hypothetical protein